jgi:hypothetical protein
MTTKLSAAEIRRQKILKNSQNRLNLLMGNPKNNSTLKKFKPASHMRHPFKKAVVLYYNLIN